MKNSKQMSVSLILMAILCLFPKNVMAEDYEISFSGNAYTTKNHSGARITQHGLTSWNSKETTIALYFFSDEASTCKLYLVADGNSKILVESGRISKQIRINSRQQKEYLIKSHYNIKKGYNKITLKGIKAPQNAFGNVQSIKLKDCQSKLSYVNNFSEYWGRRGPSVHMGYPFPQEEDIEYFYNEATVPKDGEIMHSYYMAAGFGEGYFGMQYNSDTERRVLFSVWSPFDTQDPKKIPEDSRIKMLRQGEGVHIGTFGNEGSGGQSFLRYNWKAGNTYKFLMQVHPDSKGNTIYTAYFYATDENRWRLIASFLRPKTSTWYKRAHSFLENFNPNQGYLARKVYFSNQWAKTKSGKWISLTEGKFTYDNTAHSGVRKDYQGGTENNKFYLKMGGFFNESTPYHSTFRTTTHKQSPKINFKKLAEL